MLHKSRRLKETLVLFGPLLAILGIFLSNNLLQLLGIAICASFFLVKLFTMSETHVRKLSRTVEPTGQPLLGLVFLVGVGLLMQASRQSDSERMAAQQTAKALSEFEQRLAMAEKHARKRESIISQLDDEVLSFQLGATVDDLLAASKSSMSFRYES